MICPKCGHQQEESEQCDACGIYFEKFYAAKERMEQLQQQRELAEFEKQNRGLPIKSLAIIFAVIAVGAVIFSGKEEPADSTVATISEQTSDTSEKSDIKGIKARLFKSNTPRNKIEESRNATVFITTAWGAIGSGFMVSNDCWVVTNRHVMELNVDKETASGLSSPQYAQIISMEVMKARMELSQMINEYQILVRTQGESAESTQLLNEIELKQEQIEDLPKQIESDMISEIKKIKREGDRKGYTVSLVDETSFTIRDVKYSKKYDLALFKLPANDCPHLVTSSNDNLEQGSRLYTIGNPSGLGYTVTSGIFSGYTKIDDQQVIQTDAPINPGNSGGPLITSDGHVVGINTSILDRTEGIGFAIPIGAVKSEFGRYLKNL